MAAKKTISKKSPKSRVSLWHEVRRSPRFNLYALIIVVLVLTLAGYYAYRSRAAFAPGSIAAATLSLGGGAKTTTDSNAASGSVVQFAINSTTSSWPTAATTGPTGSLTVVNGDVHLDATWATAHPDKIFTGEDVQGNLYLEVPGITATNFAVRGEVSTPYSAIAVLADNETITHCLIDNHGDDPDISSVVLTTENKHVDMEWCNISGGTQGVRGDDGWTISNNYIHDLYAAVSGDHVDGIMFYGGGHTPASSDYNYHDIIISNNRIDLANIGQGWMNGAVFIDSGHFETNVVVNDNLFASEAYPIRIDGSYTFTNNAVQVLQPNGFGYSDANAPKDCESGPSCVYPTNGKSHNMIEFVSGNYDAVTKAPIFQ